MVSFSTHSKYNYRLIEYIFLTLHDSFRTDWLYVILNHTPEWQSMRISSQLMWISRLQLYDKHLSLYKQTTKFIINTIKNFTQYHTINQNEYSDRHTEETVWSVYHNEKLLIMCMCIYVGIYESWELTIDRSSLMWLVKWQPLINLYWMHIKIQYHQPAFIKLRKVFTYIEKKKNEIYNQI